MKIRDIIRNLIEVNTDFFRELREQRQINSSHTLKYRNLYESVHLEADPCFVLSTGRSGTALLTDIFDLSSHVKVYHEPEPELSWHSRFAWEKQKEMALALKYVIDAARYEYIRDSFLLNKRYIETNNRITFFAPYLAELYPGAKFIHLVREPSDFVRSGIARNWYSGSKLHDESRLVPPDSLMPEWVSFSQSARIAWLWNETNLFIENFKNTSGKKRVITVKAEDLFRDPAESIRIFDFAGLSIPDDFEEDVAEIIKSPVNKSSKPLDPLDDQQRADISKIAVLKKNYYPN